MKFVFSFIFCVFLFHVSFGQRIMWQYDFEVNDVYVRTDTAFQMYKQTLQIPASGHIIARIEGLCEVSKNDVITLGVSNFKNWTSNYGNVGCVSFDSIHNQHHFQHTMVYKVDKNTHTFYAVAQNWTDKNGTGVISAKGSMFLEFIPDEEGAPMVFYNQIKVYPIVLNDTIKSLSTLTVNLQKPSKVLLSADGRLYANPKDEIEISVLSSDYSTLRKADSYHVHNKKLNILSMYAAIEMPAGEHTFFLAATKKEGNLTTQNNAYYGTFYATVFPDENESIFTKSLSFEDVANEYNDENILSELSVDIPSKGTVYVMTTGQVDMRQDDRFDIRAKIDGDNVTEEFSTSCQTTHSDEIRSYFNRKQKYEVSEGKFDVTLFGRMKGNSGNSLPSDVKGDIIITFVADPVLSSTQEPKTKDLKQNLVYPNPVTHQLFIRNLSGRPYEEIVLKDTKGMAICQVDPTAGSIDVSSLPSGIYMLCIRQENNTEYHKIFVSTPSF